MKQRYEWEAKYEVVIQQWSEIPLEKKTVCSVLARSDRSVSGRCLHWVVSSWSLSSESKLRPWTRPSTRRPGSGCGNVRRDTTRRSGWSERRRCTTSLPSGSERSYLETQGMALGAVRYKHAQKSKRDAPNTHCYSVTLGCEHAPCTVPSNSSSRLLLHNSSRDWKELCSVQPHSVDNDVTN